MLAATRNSENSKLKEKVYNLEKSVEEAVVGQARSEELISVLKEEIRKLERDKKRNEGINLEYLKNVLIQYIQADSAGKMRLFPVISTILQFSPAEKEAVEGKTGGKRIASNSQFLKWGRGFKG